MPPDRAPQHRTGRDRVYARGVRRDERGRPSRVGESIRVVGTNPFIVGSEGEEGNRFRDLIADLDIECYVINTGAVGTDDPIDVGVEETVAVLEGAARNRIEWGYNDDLGLTVPSSVRASTSGSFLRCRSRRRLREAARRSVTTVATTSTASPTSTTRSATRDVLAGRFGRHRTRRRKRSEHQSAPCRSVRPQLRQTSEPWSLATVSLHREHVHRIPKQRFGRQITITRRSSRYVTLTTTDHELPR